MASAASYFGAPRGVTDRAALDALGGRVLDLGCGPGSYARYLEERGVTVVAVDASPGAISVCRERGCRDARAVEIDLVGPDLGSFDTIISYFIFVVVIFIGLTVASLFVFRRRKPTNGDVALTPAYPLPPVVFLLLTILILVLLGSRRPLDCGSRC